MTHAIELIKQRDQESNWVRHVQGVGVIESPAMYDRVKLDL